MTGDFTPDLVALLSADIIISTPEKWDGISRSWQSRSYVMKVKALFYICNTWELFGYLYLDRVKLPHTSNYQQVGLMILDEIHLLGADRGPILEVLNQKIMELVYLFFCLFATIILVVHFSLFCSFEVAPTRLGVNSKNFLKVNVC